MAVHFNTSTPRKLLAAYKKAIDDGHVTTWSYDKDGDFTHTAAQWNRRAWLRPRIVEDKRLSFHIITPKESQLTSAVYAVYHGRFIESLLRHCDRLFDTAEATALPDKSDTL